MALTPCPMIKSSATVVVRSNPAVRPTSTRIVSPALRLSLQGQYHSIFLYIPTVEKSTSLTGPITGAATAAIPIRSRSVSNHFESQEDGWLPPVAAITVWITKSLKRMHGKNNGDESPH